MTPDQITWLTWGAIETRKETHGCGTWDHPGTRQAITQHCGTWGLAAATEHVLAHARDPKARTPFAIKGNAPHTTPERGIRYPAKAGSPDECRTHAGEWADNCRACRAPLAADETPDERRATPTGPVVGDYAEQVQRLRELVKGRDQ